ncbi:MAG: response regulator [Bdellovibrionales bacterium]|nr:response regulator [Bdellovibrionales bacterium]
MAQHILLVDDEPDLLEFLHEELIEWGYNVTCALNGKEALEILGRTKVDLVLSDINMPYMDGIQLLDEIVKSFNPRPVVILMTGFDGYEKSDLREKGATDLIRKPFELDKVKRDLQELLL